MATKEKKTKESLEKFQLDPELAIFEEVQETGENTEEILECIKYVNSTLEELKKKSKIGPQGPQGIQGPAGQPGESGYTPEKGKDYYTDEEVNEFTDFMSVLFFEMLPDSAKIQLEELKGEDRLDISHIKGIERFLSRDVSSPQLSGKNKGGIWEGSANPFAVFQNGTIKGKDIKSFNFIGATINNNNGDITINISSGIAGTWNEEYPATGVVDGSNKVYIFTHIPAFISLEGQTLSILNGDYTVSGNTITLTNAPISNPPINKYLS